MSATTYETVVWEQDGGGGRITLHRPDSLNAWNAEFGEELRALVHGEAADPSVRAVLVRGAGRGFSSGADLKGGFEPADDGMPDIRKALQERYHPIIVGVRELEKPVVAAVHGAAAGIGAPPPLPCDPFPAAGASMFS